MSKLTHDRKDISNTIDRLIELGFKKGSLLAIFPNKNYHMLMRRYRCGKYSDEDVFEFGVFKNIINTIISQNNPHLWVRDLFFYGLTRRYIYKEVLGNSLFTGTTTIVSSTGGVEVYSNYKPMDSYNFHKLLKNNDFSKEQLAKLNKYKKELKKAIK